MRSIVLVVVLSCAINASQCSAQSDNLSKLEPGANGIQESPCISPKITINVQVLEISRSKLKNRNMDLFLFDENSSEKVDAQNGVLHVNLKGAAFTSYAAPVEILRDEGFARTIATSILSTGDGIPVAYATSPADGDINGGVSRGLGVDSVGTEIEILPRIIENNRIHIRLHLGNSEIVTYSAPGQTRQSRVRHRELDTKFDADSGEVFVVSKTWDQPIGTGEVEEVAIVVSVTPKLPDNQHVEAEKSPKFGRDYFRLSLLK